MQKLANSK